MLRPNYQNVWKRLMCYRLFGSKAKRFSLRGKCATVFQNTFLNFETFTGVASRWLVDYDNKKKNYLDNWRHLKLANGWNNRPGEPRWIPSPERYQTRICKVVVLVFSVELLCLLSYNNHLFLLCFSSKIQEDRREEQTPGWQEVVLCKNKQTKTIFI